MSANDGYEPTLPPLNGTDPNPPPPATREPPPAPMAYYRLALLAAGVAGALVAAVTAATIITQIDNAETPGETHTRAAVTVTAAPPAMPAVPAVPAVPAPTPLPAEEANRQTCKQGWILAGNFIHAAQEAVADLPPSSLGDPALLGHPDWVAATQQAAGFYYQASEALKSAVDPGTTPVLADASTTAVKALRLLADVFLTNDAISDNAIEIANAASKDIGVLCMRLVP
jgi:hypothetical protein